MKKFVLLTGLFIWFFFMSHNVQAQEFVKKETVPVDRWFEKITEFSVKVKKDYFKDGFTDKYFKDFGKSSQPLSRSEKYQAFVYKIKASVNAKDCLDFIAKQGGLLPNGAGLVLVANNYSDKLPYGEDVRIIGFDGYDFIHVDPLGHAWPYLYVYKLNEDGSPAICPGLTYDQSYTGFLGCYLLFFK